MHEIWSSWTNLLSSDLQWPNHPFSRNSSIKSVNNNAQLWYWICYENQNLSRCMIFDLGLRSSGASDWPRKYVFYGKLTSVAFWSVKYKLFIWRLSIMSEFFVDCVGLSHICVGGDSYCMSTFLYFYYFLLSQKRFNYLMEKTYMSNLTPDFNYFSFIMWFVK